MDSTTLNRFFRLRSILPAETLTDLRTKDRRKVQKTGSRKSACRDSLSTGGGEAASFFFFFAAGRRQAGGGGGHRCHNTPGTGMHADRLSIEVIYPCFSSRIPVRNLACNNMISRQDEAFPPTSADFAIFLVSLSEDSDLWYLF